MKTKDCSATVDGLKPNTMYEMRCKRLYWDDDFGPVIRIRTGPGAPGAPHELCQREVTSSSILICWQLPKKDNGLPVLEYIVRMKSVVTEQAQRHHREALSNECHDHNGSAFADGDDEDAEEAALAAAAADAAGGGAERDFVEVFRGKERCYMATDLVPNSVYVFEVCAVNRAGAGEAASRLPVRTLPEVSDNDLKVACKFSRYFCLTPLEIC